MKNTPMLGCPNLGGNRRGSEPDLKMENSHMYGFSVYEVCKNLVNRRYYSSRHFRTHGSTQPSKSPGPMQCQKPHGDPSSVYGGLYGESDTEESSPSVFRSYHSLGSAELVMLRNHDYGKRRFTEQLLT